MHPTIASLLRASIWRFVGRLGSDPEVRYFQSGAAVANVRIAVNQPGAKRDDGLEPDWFKLEVWGADEARAFADSCRKGSLVDVSGRFKVETWTDRNGEERTGTTIRVESWQPVGQQQTGAPAAAAAQPAPAPAAATAWDSADDASLPF
jgi:single-strand DNA-binding protein